MTSLALQVNELCKSFGGIIATDNLSLAIEEGELHAVIGPNGAGKTTLIAQLCGQMRPTRGSIRLFGRDITRLSMPQRSRRGIVRSFQITSICREFTALANVALAVQVRQGHSFHFFRNAERDERITGPAMRALTQVGLEHRAETIAGQLAHGEQRQLELAIALACEPRLLLLDEPLAGMGAEESGKVVDLLRSLKRNYTILLVEHDMDAVFALADTVSVLVYGRCIASGPPDQVRDDPAVRDAYLGTDDSHAPGA